MLCGLDVALDVFDTCGLVGLFYIENKICFYGTTLICVICMSLVFPTLSWYLKVPLVKYGTSNLSADHTRLFEITLP